MNHAPSVPVMSTLLSRWPPALPSASREQSAVCTEVSKVTALPPSVKYSFHSQPAPEEPLQKRRAKNQVVGKTDCSQPGGEKHFRNWLKLDKFLPHTTKNLNYLHSLAPMETPLTPSHAKHQHKQTQHLNSARQNQKYCPKYKKKKVNKLCCYSPKNPTQELFSLVCSLKA